MKKYENPEETASNNPQVKLKTEELAGKKGQKDKSKSREAKMKADQQKKFEASAADEKKAKTQEKAAKKVESLERDDKEVKQKALEKRRHEEEIEAKKKSADAEAKQAAQAASKANEQSTKRTEAASKRVQESNEKKRDERATKDANELSTKKIAAEKASKESDKKVRALGAELAYKESKVKKTAEMERNAAEREVKALEREEEQAAEKKEKQKAIAVSNNKKAADNKDKAIFFIDFKVDKPLGSKVLISTSMALVVFGITIAEIGIYVKLNDKEVTLKLYLSLLIFHFYFELSAKMMKMIPYKFNFLARAKVDNLTELIQKVVDKLKDLVRKFNAAVERAKKSIDDAKDACYKLYPPKWEDVQKERLDKVFCVLNVYNMLSLCLGYGKKQERVGQASS